VDNGNISKETFDYARVLIATSSLEMINVSHKILINGVLVELKIIEEWGFSIGEDACLLEDDVAANESILDNNLYHSLPKAREHAKELINSLPEDWATDDNVQKCRMTVQYHYYLRKLRCNMVSTDGLFKRVWIWNHRKRGLELFHFVLQHFMLRMGQIA